MFICKHKKIYHHFGDDVHQCNVCIAELGSSLLESSQKCCLFGFRGFSVVVDYFLAFIQL